MDYNYWKHEFLLDVGIGALLGIVICIGLYSVLGA